MTSLLLAIGIFISRFTITYLLLGTLIDFVFIEGFGYAASSRSDLATPPEVIVLVLSGVGPFDQVAVNYANFISRRQTEKDIREIKRISGWPLRNINIVTHKDAASGVKLINSSRFEVPPIANKTEGTLSLEPFISALKRFKSIQVIYLVPGEFRFRGLKDFENDYVKIKLKQREGAYTYQVQVKDPRFDNLNLPLKEDMSTEMQKTNMSVAARLVRVLIVAFAGGILVYLIAARFSRSSTNRQSEDSCNA